MYPVVANLGRVCHKTKMHVTHIAHKIYITHVKARIHVFLNVISESQLHHLLVEVFSQKWSPYTKQATTSDGRGGVHHTNEWQTHLRDTRCPGPLHHAPVPPSAALKINSTNLWVPQVSM